MADRDILLSDLNDISEILNNNGYGGWCKTIRKAVDLLKEQEKLINVDELREKLGFSDNCENCKQNARYCQYDSHFAFMDFCERLDMAIEELRTEGR